MRLRPLRQEDVPVIMKIMKENDDSTRSDAEKRFQKYLDNASAKNHFNFAMIQGRKVVGVLSFKNKQDSWNVSWLHVDKKYQNKGFGSAALKQAEEMIAKKGGTKIQLSTGYPRAIGFYVRRGYKIKNIVENYYPSGDAKTILEKRMRE